MKKYLFIISILSVSLLVGQTNPLGTKAWADQNQARLSDPTVQNGNNFLGSIYDSTACGLNYTQASLKLGQRGTIGGVLQPAAFPINNIPFCGNIVKSYLWCVGSGNGIPINATITNPLGSTQSFPMTIVGQGVDMCWAYSGTYVYRADVTGIINGNGNYIISGIPTNPPTTGNDMDGATLLIIYDDVAASYTGSIHIDDGAVVINGGMTNQIMTGFNSCANSTSANGFMIVADLQYPSSQIAINGGPHVGVNGDWHNFISQPTTVTQGQSTCDFEVSTGGDCYCLAVSGLYSQTTCNTCTPAVSVLNVTIPNITSATCTNNGSATIAVTGGSGNYNINWNTNPLQTGLTATNLAPGNYYVSVVDSIAGACSSVNVIIPYTGPVLTTTTTGVNCSTLGTATVNVSGGQTPYTYSWAPSGGNSANASNLSAGTYVVTVTDNSGCVVSANAVVPNNTTLIVNISVTPDSCPSPTGAASATVTGGQAPYTFLWAPGNQTTASITNLSAGSYTLNVTDGLGCVVSNVVTVNAITVPMNVTSSNVNISCGSSAQLNATANYANATYVWTPTTFLNNPNIANPISTPTSTITYTVTANSVCGSGSTTASVIIAGTNIHIEQICVVSVDTAINKNVITWERNNSPSNGSYNIYRETSTAGVYAIIGTQPISQFSTYTDLTSSPMNYASRYEISTVDTCGFESAVSVHHRTLFLQISAAIPTGYNLLWTAYEGLTIGTYNIYRGASASTLSLIASIPGTTYNYTDVNPPVGPLIYLVEAVHPLGGCTPSLRLANPAIASSNGSLSNLSPTSGVGMNENNLLENSLIITPNPGNGIFQLSFIISDAQEVSIEIYNNLGQKVYVQNEKGITGSFNTTMDLSSLSAGMYFVKVACEKGVITKRLIIE
ncbi:hypothetical protein BH09BAC5_BH09BAC5_24350 [soil metagenome]